MRRHLFIALGGTGGKTMKKLYENLTEDQKRNANCIYLDTDQDDCDELHCEGINAVKISSGGTIGEIAVSLADKRVYDWMPSNNANAGDRVFLDSHVFDGASQCRYKSRLCMARYLKKSNNELKKMMEAELRPGIVLTEENLHVVIVSSVAGGTGAGTFIEVALYVRKFLREHEQGNVRIIGILGCPDLYVDLNTDEDDDVDNKKRAMYANAYAAIRELNAMNLATSGESAVTNDYGKRIKISINTKSEGKLFDSEDPYFTGTSTAKPFDQLYFIDRVNQQGGILGNVDNYYKTMADLAYAKLFSPLAGDIASQESNEMNRHELAPTAIYGGAGYARMIYPYEDILKYLAERKTAEEIGSSWRVFDDQWRIYYESEMDKAMSSGRSWQPAKGQRGEEYIKQVDKELHRGTASAFHYMRSMIQSENEEDLVELYMEKLEELVSCTSGMDAVGGSAGMNYGTYSVAQDNKVRNAITSLINDFISCASFIKEEPAKGLDALDESSPKGVKTVVERLDSLIKRTKSDWDVFAGQVRAAVSSQAYSLASAIMPVTDTAVDYAKRQPSEINLHRALLCDSKGGDIHPLAARYLLYKLQAKMHELADSADSNLNVSLRAIGRKLELAFDENPDDAEDWLAADELDYISKKGKIGIVRRTEDAARIYLESLQECTDEALAAVGDAVMAEAFRSVLEVLDELIAQYEGFFENLEQYQIAMQNSMRGDRVSHDRDEDQFIYVGASAEMKDHYYFNVPSVRMALEAGSKEYYAAAGAGVYDALEKRTRKMLAEKKINWRLGTETRNTDKYDDMGGVFTAVVDYYVSYLRDKCTYLKTDALGALVNEVCQENGLELEDVVGKDAKQTLLFEKALAYKFADLKAKAKPMIRYSKDNTEKYYLVEEESEDDLFNVSIAYSFLGMSEATKERLSVYFPSSAQADGALNTFKTKMDIRSVVTSSTYSDYEIFCFGAVHCLQPTQIYHFNEQQEDSYYEQYREAVRSALARGSLSGTPHLDKRWHLKGCMPYISKTMECKWRVELMKAFLSRILLRKIIFSKTAENVECFFNCEEGYSMIQWPAGQPVLARNISRVLEFLAEDENSLLGYAADLDKLIEQCKRRLTNYSNSVGDYKRGMTMDKLMARLRTDSLQYRVIVQTGSSRGGRTAAGLSAAEKEKAMEVRKAIGAYTEGDEAEEVVDLKKTMGGILRLAYMLHCSEEKLGEDRDYGEALLAAVAYVIDEVAKGMYGEEHVDSDTQWHREYIDIYNHAIDKFLSAYVEEEYRRKKWDVTEMVPTESDDLLEEDAIVDDLDLQVPDALRNSDAFIWIRKYWKHKQY